MAAKRTSAFNRADDPRVQPAYTVAEAAHYVRMPEVTLRSWVSGRLYPVSGQQRKSSPLIHLDDPKGQYLSFINLVEAHVLDEDARGGAVLRGRAGEQERAHHQADQPGGGDDRGAPAEDARDLREAEAPLEVTHRWRWRTT